MNFILKNRYKIISEYTGKSKFDFLYHMKEDSVIEVRSNIARYYGYAVDIEIEIISGEFAGEKFKCTSGTFNNYFERIKVVEL